MPVVIVLVVALALAGLFVAAGFMDVDVPQKDVSVEIDLPGQKVEAAPEMQRPAPSTPAGLTAGAPTAAPVPAPTTQGTAE